MTNTLHALRLWRDLPDLRRGTGSDMFQLSDQSIRYKCNVGSRVAAHEAPGSYLSEGYSHIVMQRPFLYS